MADNSVPPVAPQPDSDGDHVYVEDVSSEIIQECERIPESEDTGGGVVCTGFLNVERLIYTGRKYHKKVLFLEKKLPFQLLLLEVRGSER